MTSPTIPMAERVGRYQLLEPIGEGPCGAVSRAKVFGVAGFERQFAIKRFHAEITASTTMAASLSAAARGYGSLEHPRIARMSEYGVAQGTTFTAVEFVAGLDAHRLVAEAQHGGGALATGGALALVSQAARAVGYAHGRGLTHLGLAPTNVIVTSEGDIKITDFGILAATMPTRPVDALRLVNRVAYLAPEQIAGEATSAATDVFALGVLAIELITGRRAYAGESPQQVARAILEGPLPEPPLPRPIVRVLQRCLARSPFERFPDARALADALDAALRVAPVPGTRKDIGAQVKTALERIAAQNAGEHSGVLSLGVAAATRATGAAAPAKPLSSIPVLGNKATTELTAASESASELRTTERDSRPAGKRPISTPMSTVAGLAPPPPAVTPATTPASTAATPPPIPGGPKPAPRVKDGASMIPTLTKPAASRRPPLIDVDTKPGIEPPVKIPEGHHTPGVDLGELELELEGEPQQPHQVLKHETDPGVGIQPAVPADRQQRPTHEMSAVMAKQLKIAATKPTRDIEKFAPVPPDSAVDTLPDELDMSFAETAIVSDEQKAKLAVESTTPEDDELELQPARTSTVSSPFPGPLGDDLDDLDDADDQDDPDDDDRDLHDEAERAFERTVLGPGAPPSGIAAGPRPIATKPGFEPPAKSAPLSPHQLAAQGNASSFTPVPMPPAGDIRLPGEPPRPRSDMPMASAAPQTALVATPAPPPAAGSRKGLWLALSVLGLAGLGVGGFFAYEHFLAPADTMPTPVATAPADAAAQTAPAPDAIVAAASVDAGAAAPAPVDAQLATAPSDAGAATSSPTGAGDALQITSTPPGARVFIDGADSGVTPLKLPATSDKHSIALFLPAHELYIAQVDGRGTFAINLKSVTPSDGPAGIKVTRCKDKDRFYVSVDGKPTGQTCPTERIHTTLGPHTVEIYDLHTEKHTEYKIEITDTRLSYRVKVDP